MSIVKYMGQPLPQGTIVCCQSMLKAGICSRPVKVVKETTSAVRVADMRDGDEKNRRKSSVLFICDTEDEGQSLLQASMGLVEAEQVIYTQQRAERVERKRLAIEAALQRAAS